MATVTNNLAELEKYLKDHQIKASFHRIKILEYLWEKNKHVNAETVYQAILPSIPTLSRTTVYNTLNLFAQKGIVKPLTIQENQVIYDPLLNTHAHFQCKSCGKVYDIEVPTSFQDFTRTEEGHRIEERHLYFKGICKPCQEQ
jgi:Fe2+ or Zn2+ uptake regulation protein